jgi:hypothetical protein
VDGKGGLPHPVHTCKDGNHRFMHCPNLFDLKVVRSDQCPYEQYTKNTETPSGDAGRDKVSVRFKGLDRGGHDLRTMRRTPRQWVMRPEDQQPWRATVTEVFLRPDAS